MMGFLAALPSEYDSVRAQILSSPEVSSFQETFSRILCIEISLFALPFASGPRGNTRGPNFGGVVYYYCRKLGHVIRDSKKP